MYSRPSFETRAKSALLRRRSEKYSQARSPRPITPRFVVMPSWCFGFRKIQIGGCGSRLKAGTTRFGVVVRHSLPHQDSPRNTVVALRRHAKSRYNGELEKA